MFFALNYFHFVSDYFLVKQSVFELLNYAIFTPFAVLDSLPSIFFIEYKLINYFSFRHVFHFTNNFVISLIKKL